MNHKKLIASIILGLALVCPIALAQSPHCHTNIVKANTTQSRGYSPYYDSSIGSTAGTYNKNYSGTQPHDDEANSANQLWEDNPPSNEMSENKEEEQQQLNYTPNPVDLKLHFYYYDPTDENDKSNFADIQDGIYNKGDTVNVDGLFREAGHGHGYGYANSSNPVVKNYSDFVINNNKTWWVPVKSNMNVIDVGVHFVDQSGNFEGGTDVNNLEPGQSLNLSQVAEQENFTPEDSNDIVIVPTSFWDNKTYNVPVVSSASDTTSDNDSNNSESNNDNSDNDSGDTDGDISVTFETPNGNYLGSGDFSGLTVGSTFNLSDAARHYDYVPVHKHQTMTVPNFGSSDSNPTVIVEDSSNSSSNTDTDNSITPTSNDSSNSDTSTSNADNSDIFSNTTDDLANSASDSSNSSASDLSNNNLDDNDVSDNTNTSHHHKYVRKNKQRHVSNKSRLVKRWLSNHIYRNRSQVHYVRYRGFSRHQWRMAFPHGTISKHSLIGLSRSYRAVLRSAESPSNHIRHYKADVIVKPWQSFQVKIIKKVGRGDYIFVARFHNKHYYYTEFGDKWDSEISPFTAIYDKHNKGFRSSVKPWWQKNIYLNYRYKLRHNAKWYYSYADYKDDSYRLYGNKWHENLDSTESPY